MPGPRDEKQRRVVLQQGQFNPDSRQLRSNLIRLERLLSGSDPFVRRRVRLMFGELISQWYSVIGNRPLVVTLELLPRAARLTACAEHRKLTEAEWRELVTPIILEFADAWALDRRQAGGAWFEFREALPGAEVRGERSRHSTRR